MKKLLAVSMMVSSMFMMGCGFIFPSDEAGIDFEGEVPSVEEYWVDTTLDQEELETDEVPEVRIEDQAVWAEQVNRFGYLVLDQYKGLESNILISPAALHGALTMAAHGADGTTYDELSLALSLGAERAAAIQLSADMQLNLRFDGQHENSRLVMANYLWFDESVRISESFKESMIELFKSPVQICNFLDHAVYVFEKINEWLMDLTYGLVSRLAEPEKIEFMLVNATSFVGKWAYPFDSSRTASGVFTGSTKETVIDFMHLIYDFKYYENAEKGYQAVVIPYMDDVFDMVIILPNDISTAEAVLEDITAEEFGTIMVEAADTKLIELSLPKFEVSYDIEPNDLIEKLKNIGIEEAFVRGFANFNFLSPSGSVFIDSVLHQAVIAIDEGGTNLDSGALTDGTADKGDSDKEVLGFNVDHAFAFALVHRSSGAVVYLGLMHNL